MRMPTANDAMRAVMYGDRGINNLDREAQQTSGGQSYGYGGYGGAGITSQAMPSPGPTAQDVADDSFRQQNYATQQANAGRSAAVANTMSAFDPAKASPEDIAAAQKALGFVDAGQEYTRRQGAVASAQNDLDNFAQQSGFKSDAIRRALGDETAGDSKDGAFAYQVQNVQDRLKSDPTFASWAHVHTNALNKATAEFEPLRTRGMPPPQSPSANPTGNTDPSGPVPSPQTPAQRLAGTTYRVSPSPGGQLYDGTPQMPNLVSQEYNQNQMNPMANPQMASELRLIAANRARAAYDASPAAKEYQDQAQLARDAQVAGLTSRGLQQQRLGDQRNVQTYADESAQRQSIAAQGFANANAPVITRTKDGDIAATPRQITYSPSRAMPSAPPGSVIQSQASPQAATAQTHLTPGLPVTDGSAGYLWYDDKNGGVRTDLQTGEKTAYVNDPKHGWISKDTGAPLNVAAQSSASGQNASMRAPGVTPPQQATNAGATDGAPAWTGDPFRDAMNLSFYRTNESFRRHGNPPPGGDKVYNGNMASLVTGGNAPQAQSAPKSTMVGGVTLTQQPDGTWLGANGRRYRGNAGGKWQLVG